MDFPLQRPWWPALPHCRARTVAVACKARSTRAAPLGIHLQRLGAECKCYDHDAQEEVSQRRAGTVADLLFSCGACMLLCESGVGRVCARGAGVSCKDTVESDAWRTLGASPKVRWPACVRARAAASICSISFCAYKFR